DGGGADRGGAGPPGVAAAGGRAGSAAAARRGPAPPWHRPRPRGGARHGQKHVTPPLGKLRAANSAQAAARAPPPGPIPRHRPQPVPVAPRGARPPPSGTPLDSHLRVTPRGGRVT